MNLYQSGALQSNGLNLALISYNFFSPKSRDAKWSGRRPCLFIEKHFSLSAPKKYFSNSPPLARLELIGRALISILRSSSVLPPWRRMRRRFRLIINGAGKLKQKRKKWKKRKRWKSGWVTILLPLYQAHHLEIRQKSSEEFHINFKQ